MAFTPTTNLSLPLIDTGTESGTWGELVDNGLTSYLDIAIAGGLAISITGTGTVVTLVNTAGTSSATGIISTGATGSTAQYAILNISGAKTGACTLNLPVTSKWYIINNAGTGGFALTVRGVTPTTGVTVADGERCIVAWSGTDYVKIGAEQRGASNIGIGTSALISNTSGNTSVAIGSSALTVNNTGYSNIAIGSNALLANTSGNSNVAIGVNALASNVASTSNVAVGYYALSAAANLDNTAVGFQALRLATGARNTSVGSNSLRYVTAGDRNVAFGNSSLGGVSLSGSYNTAIGTDSGDGITTGSGNVIVGGYTAAGASAPAFNITTENNRVSMGSTAVTNAYIQVAWTVVSDARDKTDFADVPHGLDFVSKLQPTAYRYKETRDSTEGHGPLRYGFKAQDVLALEGDTPVIVDAEDADKLYFNDQSMIAVLVNAIKELKAEFDAYKATHP